MVFSNETDLIKKLRLGDERAVQLWYEQSRAKLSAFFMKRTSETRDIDELVHDTYLSCLASLPLFRGQSSLYSWMIGIARHELSDYWRKKYAKRAIALLPFGQEVLDLMEVEEASGIEARGKRQEASELRELLRKLPEGVAELLELKYVDGFSVQELATQFGVSFSAMQSRLHRAKALFKAEYEEVVLSE